MLGNLEFTGSLSQKLLVVQFHNLLDLYYWVVHILLYTYLFPHHPFTQY